jgi:hypothetical protein
MTKLRPEFTFQTGSVTVTHINRAKQLAGEKTGLPMAFFHTNLVNIYLKNMDKMIIYNPFNLYLNNISAHKNASDYPDTRAKRKERKKERKKERRRGNQQRQKVFSAGKSDMSSSSEAEANPKENAREKRMQDFLGDDDDESTWSPPAKVKKAQEKRKKEEKTQRTDRMTEAFIDLFQVRRLIWSLADSDHMDHMKVSKAWDEVLASLQDQFAQKVLDESGMGSVSKLKTRYRTLREAFNK